MKKTKNPANIQSSKVGRWPLRELSSEKHSHYEMVDYLYDSPHGFVWCRVIFEVEQSIWRIQMEFVHCTRKYSAWIERKWAYTPLAICAAGRKFAQQIESAGIYAKHA